MQCDQGGPYVWARPELGGTTQSQVFLQSGAALIYSCTHAVNVQVMDELSSCLLTLKVGANPAFAY